MPEADKIISGNISNGLVASQSSPAYNVVNPKELQITCGSAIPVREINISGTQLPRPENYLDVDDTYTLGQPVTKGGKWENLNPDIVSFDESTRVVTAINVGKAIIEYIVDGVVNKKHLINVFDTFGIKPMALTASDITESELKITVSRNTAVLDSDSVNKSFIFEEELKNMPAAIWKPAEVTGSIPDQSGSHLLKNLCSGLKISAQPPTKSGDGFPFDLADANATLTMPAATATTPFTYLKKDFSHETQH